MLGAIKTFFAEGNFQILRFNQRQIFQIFMKDRSGITDQLINQLDSQTRNWQKSKLTQHCRNWLQTMSPTNWTKIQNKIIWSILVFCRKNDSRITNFHLSVSSKLPPPAHTKKVHYDQSFNLNTTFITSIMLTITIYSNFNFATLKLFSLFLS